MIDTYIETGIRQFAISSSGNAGLTAALHILKKNNESNKLTQAQTLTLTVFVGQHIRPEKLKKLKVAESQSASAIIIDQVDKPFRKLLEVTKDPSIKSLWQAGNDEALKGYEKLAEELMEIPNLYAVFIPSSSGTTAQGLNQAFHKYGKSIQIHIVQTTQIHKLICDELRDDESGNIPTQERSIADAIVDKIGIRKNDIRKIIQKSGGAGWIVNNQEIEMAIQLVKEKTGIDISANSALSIAGLQKALAIKKDGDATQGQSRIQDSHGALVCIITGN
jgi:threonine dehydratase